MKITINLQMHGTEILFKESRHNSEAKAMKSLKSLKYNETELKEGHTWTVGTHTYILHISK